MAIRDHHSRYMFGLNMFKPHIFLWLNPLHSHMLMLIMLIIILFSSHNPIPPASFGKKKHRWKVMKSVSWKSDVYPQMKSVILVDCLYCFSHISPYCPHMFPYFPSVPHLFGAWWRGCVFVAARRLHCLKICYIMIDRFRILTSNRMQSIIESIIGYDVYSIHIHYMLSSCVSHAYTYTYRIIQNYVYIQHMGVSENGVYTQNS